MRVPNLTVGPAKGVMVSWVVLSVFVQPSLAMTWPYEVQVKILSETNPVTFSMWLPTATPKIKGLVICHTHGDGGVFAENQSVLAMAQEAGLGIIKFYASSMKSFKITAGNDRDITSALNALAQKSSHPEVAVVPLCPFGHSSACKFSAGMANLWSDRVFAYIAWKPAGTVNMLKAADLTPKFMEEPGLYLSGTLEGADLGNPPGVSYASIETRVEEFRAMHVANLCVGRHNSTNAEILNGRVSGATLQSTNYWFGSLISRVLA